MTKVDAYLGRHTVLTNLTEEEVSMLMNIGFLHKTRKGHHLVREQEGYKHLFSTDVPTYKKLKYFKRFDEVRFTCEHCGVQPSFHVSPKIDEDGTVNFKEIVCVCQSCRSKKLRKKGILTPQFRLDFSKEALNTIIEKEIGKYYDQEEAHILLNDENYMKLKRTEKRLSSIIRIPLPPLNESEKYKQLLSEVMEKLRILSIDYTINLKNGRNREVIYEFLHKETGSKCPCCAKRVEVSEVTLDHIRPISKGGRDTLENLTGLCRQCNQDKGNIPIIDYLLQREFLALPPRLLKMAYKEQEEAEKKLKKVRGSVFATQKRLLRRKHQTN